jgi:ribosomal protein S18 acetylase RimI-like enzyme
MGMRPDTYMLEAKSKSSYAKLSAVAAGVLRIEPVDNWHAAWGDVLKLALKSGSAKKLRIDPDGWLSARQVLMVAFVAGRPAALLCFSVAPSIESGIEARHMCHAIEPRFQGRGIESQLYQAAVERAVALGCGKFRAVHMNSKWR